MLQDSHVTQLGTSSTWNNGHWRWAWQHDSHSHKAGEVWLYRVELAAVEDDVELSLPLSPPEHWDYTNAPLDLVYEVLGIEPELHVGCASPQTVLQVTVRQLCGNWLMWPFPLPAGHRCCQQGMTDTVGHWFSTCGLLLSENIFLIDGSVVKHI